MKQTVIDERAEKEEFVAREKTRLMESLESDRVAMQEAMVKECEHMVEEGMAAETERIAHALGQAEAAVVAEKGRADQAEAAYRELQELLAKERERMAESLHVEKTRAGMAAMETAMMTDELERQKSIWLAKHGEAPRKETEGESREAWAAADMAMQALESALELSPKKEEPFPQMLALD